MMALAVLIPAKKRRVHQRNKPILSHLVTSQLLPLFFISHQLVVIFYPILKFIKNLFEHIMFFKWMVISNGYFFHLIPELFDLYPAVWHTKSSCTIRYTL
jgi:hypothetical protein